MRRFEQLNPFAVAFYYACVLAVTMFSMEPLIVVVSLASSVTAGVLDRSANHRAHLFSAALFVIVAALNPVFVHNGATALFYLNGRPFTLEATVYGVCAAAMIVSALYRLRSLSKALTSDRVLYLFGRFSPKLALLLSMTLRYVALLRIRWHKIQDTQRALGLYDDGNLIDALRGRARVLSILLTWTLENGIVTAESMEARGYGSGRRTAYAVYRMHIGDGIVIMICAALTALTAVGIAYDGTAYYPDLYLDVFSPWAITGAAAFAVLSVLPLIINGEEGVKWRFLISKI